jgi:hypothetical protein
MCQTRFFATTALKADRPIWILFDKKHSFRPGVGRMSRPIQGADCTEKSVLYVPSLIFPLVEIRVAFPDCNEAILAEKNRSKG